MKKYINKIINGDCLEVIKTIKNESIDLIYIDPPFYTNRDFIEYNDKWDTLHYYLTWLNIRLYEIKRVLKNTGSFYLHCDWHASHHLKIMLDKVFGNNNFRNDIIWYYKNGGGRGKIWFNRKHDTILFYVKNKNYVYNGLKVGDKRTEKEGTFSGYFKTDKDGRRYQEVRANKKIYKYYVGDPKNPDDVWNIPIIAQRDKIERTGYPTQKPEALLERIIKASSDKNDVVADFFCGSGTTLKVAQKLGRKYIGCDINKKAVEISKERLKQKPLL